MDPTDIFLLFFLLMKGLLLNVSLTKCIICMGGCELASIILMKYVFVCTYIANVVYNIVMTGYPICALLCWLWRAREHWIIIMVVQCYQVRT